MTRNLQSSLFIVLSFALLTCSIATAAPIVTPGGFDVDEELAGVRYRSFGNSGGEEIYLGVPDLGAPPRSATDITWVSGTNNVEWTFDPNTDSMTTTVTNSNGGSPFVLNYSNFAADLITKGKTLGLNQITEMQINVADRDNPGTSVAFNNVMLDGNPLGDFTAPGINSFWTVSNFDFASGFTLTGDIVLAGSFSGSQEKSRVGLTLGAVPEPTSLALLGLAAFCAAGIRRRSN